MIKTKLEELNLLDKFLFDEAMEDRETYQAVISILLENEVELLEKPETEKELRVSPELRQVRLDVVGMDEKGKLYYAEMQKKDTGNLIRRSRYYQAQLDVSLLEPGSKDFNLLFPMSSWILWNILKGRLTKRPKRQRVNGSGRYMGESVRSGSPRKRG